MISITIGDGEAGVYIFKVDYDSVSLSAKEIFLHLMAPISILILTHRMNMAHFALMLLVPYSNINAG